MPPQEKVFSDAESSEPESMQQQQTNNQQQLETTTGCTNACFVSDCSNAATTLTNVKLDQHQQRVAKDTDSQKNVNDDAFEFDDLLPHIGEFGIYQKILFLLMIPFSFFVAWVYFSQIFITIVPDQHWCWVPALANMSIEQR